MSKDIIILKHNNNICGYYLSKVAAEIFINNCISCNFIKNTDKVELEYYVLNSNIFNKKENFSFKNTKNPNKIKIKNKSIKINKHLYEDFSDTDITSITLSDNEYHINKDEYHIKEQILDIDTDTDSDKKIIPNSETDESFTLDAEAFLKKKKEERNHYQKIVEIDQEKIDILSHINKLKLEKQKIIEDKIKYDYDLELYKKFKQIIKNNDNFNIPLLFKDKYNLFEKLENNNNLSFESFNENYFETQIKTQYEDMFINEQHSFKLPKSENFKSDNIDTLLSAAF